MTEPTKQELISQLKEEAKVLGIKGYALMGEAKLKERILEAREKTVITTDKPVAKPAAPKAVPAQVELYPFTDPSTNRIGLWEKTDKKSEVRPGDKKFPSAFRFIRWV